MKSDTHVLDSKKHEKEPSNQASEKGTQKEVK